MARAILGPGLAGYVRRDDDLGMRPERMILRQRLRVGHIQHSRRKLAAIERGDQVAGDQLPAATRLNEAGPAGQLREK